MTDPAHGRVHAFVKRYHLVGSVSIALIGGVVYTVTRADDLIRKADAVPRIEEAVLQLKVNEELATQRLEKLEQRQSALEDQINRNNAAILYRLDKILEKQDER